MIAILICLTMVFDGPVVSSFAAEVEKPNSADTTGLLKIEYNDETSDDNVQNIFNGTDENTIEETEEDSEELLTDDYLYYKPYPEANYELRYHVLDDGTIGIDGSKNLGTPYQEELILPSEIDGKSVTTISNYAFDTVYYFTGNLTIPNSITTIGDRAFCYGSFNGTLIFGNSVKTIGDLAFYECKGFKGDLTIPDSVMAIGDNAFCNCTGFKGNLIIGSGVETIGAGAFYKCGNFTGGLMIPDSVKTIGTGAFGYCSGFTGDLRLGNGVETIGMNAFTECSGFTGNLIIPDSVMTIGKSAFFQCTGFNGILTLGSNVETIEDLAFYSCNGINGGLKFGDNIKKIGYSAFEGCSGLIGSLTIPDGVTTIGNYSFRGCGFSGTLTIPDSVTTLDPYISHTTGYTKIINNSMTDLSLLSPSIFVKWRNEETGELISTIKEGTAIRSDHKDDGSEVRYNKVSYGKYRFRVKDENNDSLEGVAISFKYPGQEAQKQTTDINGCADFDLNPAWGLPLVEATKEGYMTWTNEDMNWNFNSNRYEEISMYPDDLEYKYKLRIARYEDGADLLRETKTLYLSNLSTLPTNFDFELWCSAWDAGLVRSYKLYQGTKEIASSNTGIFELNTGMFEKGGKCEILAEPRDGSAGVKTRINLKFAKKDNEKIELSVGKDTRFRIGQDVPIFGGQEMTFDFPKLPVDVLISDEKFHIGINLKGFEKYHDDEEFRKIEEKLYSAIRADNTPRDKSSLEDLVKEYKNGNLPGFDNKNKPVKWNVVGYLEAGLNDHVAKGMLYFELSAKANPNWTFVVVAVPVVVDLELSVGAKVGGELTYNWLTDNFSGRIFLDPTAKIELFGGVGVGKAVGVGVYGSGQLDLQINLVDANHNTGLRKADLTGEFGGKAYLGPFEQKKTWAYQTWNLYTATNGVRQSGVYDAVGSAGETGEDRLLANNGMGSVFDYKEIDDFYRADLSYMVNESAWYGTGRTGNGKEPENELYGSDSLMGEGLLQSPELSSPFEELLINTYQNASPVVVSDGTNAWMAFLRADAASGNVYTVLSRYDSNSQTWTEPVRVNNDAILDDKPDLICAGNDLWLTCSEAKTSYHNVGNDILDYARNRQIRVLKINKETLAIEESKTYTGTGFLSGQSLALIDGKPILSYSDGKLIDVDSIFASPETKIYLVDLSTVEKNAVKYAQSNTPVDQFIAAKYNDSLCVAYVTSDNELYAGRDGSSDLLASDVNGRVSYNTVPGTTSMSIMWNGADALCLLSGDEIAAAGITNYYDVEDGTLFFSAASGDDEHKSVLKQTMVLNGVTNEATVIKCFDARYFEDLNAFKLNGSVYLAGMNTSASISRDDLDLVKDLVWTRLEKVHDLSITGMEFDDEITTAGEAVPVTLSIENRGEETVSSVDISLDNVLSDTKSVNIQPGETADVSFDVVSPEEMTTYTISVSETGISDSEGRCSDNITSLTLGSPDLSLDMRLIVKDDQKGLSLVVRNEGKRPAEGTLVIYDKDGKVFSKKKTGILNADDIETVTVWITEQDSDRFIGSVTAELTGIENELYTYNNTSSVNADWEEEGEVQGDPEELSQASAPVITPVTGKVIENSDLITLASETENATVYYTTDGSVPTSSSLTYNGPVEAGSIAVDNKVIIKAIAVAEGYAQSDIAVSAWAIGTPDENIPTAKDETFTHPSIPSQTYTGSAITPPMDVFYGGRPLEAKKDYTIKYNNNTNAGLATFTITGKGNYSGSESGLFEIVAKSIEDDDVTVTDIPSAKVSNKEQKPVPAITYNKKKLKNGSDFEVAYYQTLEDAKEQKDPVTPKMAGPYYVRIDGVKNFTGTLIESFTIADTNEIPVSKLKIDKIPDQLYSNGEQIRPLPVVKDGGTKLKAGDPMGTDGDYVLSYGANAEIGIGTVMITGRGNYVGSRTVTFKITGIPMNRVTITGIPKTLVYDKTGQKPELTLTYKANAKASVEPILYAIDTDYEDLTDDAKKDINCIVSYKNNTDAGTATVSLTGIHKCSGTVNKIFKIMPFVVTNDPDDLFKVELSEESYPYAKGGTKPVPLVTYKGEELTEGEDYTLAYSGNSALNNGTGRNLPTVKVTGKGNFKGTDVTTTFKIIQADMETTGIRVIANDVVFQNKPGKWVTKYTVTGPDGKALKAGTDYEKNVEISNALTNELITKDKTVPAGTQIRIKVKGAGAYTGSATGTYRILSAGHDISKLTASLDPKTYTGSEIRLSKDDIIWKSGKNDVDGVEFEIDDSTYKNNLNKGKATVVVRGTGDWGGTKTITFTIGAKDVLWWWRNLLN